MCEDTALIHLAFRMASKKKRISVYLLTTFNTGFSQIKKYNDCLEPKLIDYSLGLLYIVLLYMLECTWFYPRYN